MKSALMIPGGVFVVAMVSMMKTNSTLHCCGIGYRYIQEEFGDVVKTMTLAHIYIPL